MKKTLSILLVLTMLIGSIGFTAFAEAEWPTLRVEVYDRTIAGLNLEDCMQLRYAQEKFGDPNKIKLQFVPVSRWEEGSILTVQLAGGTAADICITYQSELINQYIDMDGVYALDELLNEYGSNIKAFLGDELLGYGQFDPDGDGVKTQYVIPARRISVANVGNFIRADWLEKLNMEKPTTIEEFEKYLYAAKEANLGGQRTIPFMFDLFESNPLYNVGRYTDAFIEYDKVTEEDWIAYSKNHEMLPGSREGYRWLNKLYNDGILHDNFAIDDDDTMDSYLVQGYCGFFGQQPDQPWRFDKNYQTEMAKNVEGAEWVTVNCFANLTNGDTLHDVYAANGMNIFLPGWVSEETAINAIKYLDWMCQLENMMFLQNGVEGYNYLAVNEDGLPIQVQPTDKVPDEYKIHAGDVCFIANGLNYGSVEKNNAALALQFAGFEKQVEDSYADSLTNTWIQVSFTGLIQPETDYLAMVKSKQGEFLTKVITCAPEDFDKAYDEAIQAIMDTGAAEIIEAYREAYKAGDYRGTYPYAK